MCNNKSEGITEGGEEFYFWKAFFHNTYFFILFVIQY